MIPSFEVILIRAEKIPEMKSRMETIICKTTPEPSVIIVHELVEEFQLPEVELMVIQASGIVLLIMETDTFVRGALPGFEIVAFNVWGDERDWFAVTAGGAAKIWGPIVIETLIEVEVELAPLFASSAVIFIIPV